MFKRLILFSAVTAMSLAAANDFENKTKLDKSIITATGFQSPLRDEIRNVTIISQDDISKFGYQSIKEALEKAPGVSFSGEQVDIRGQGKKANSHVKVLLNGISINEIDTSHGITPIFMVPIEDVEQIEVIPGGGSILYGNGTSGGVINIITKQKPKDFYVNLSAKTGSYHKNDMFFGIGGIIKDDLFVKLNAKSFNEDGYRKGDNKKGYYFDASAIYKINDNHKLSFNSSHYRAKVNSTGAITKEQLEEDRRQAGEKNAERTNTMTTFSLDYHLKLNDNLALNLMPYYEKSKMETNYSLFSTEKIGGRFKTRHTYDKGELIAGYDYLYEEGKRISTRMNYPRTKRYDYDIKLKKITNSAYLLERHNFTDKFSFSVGLRGERAEYEPNRKTTTTTLSSLNKKVQQVKGKKHMNNYAFELTPSFNYSDNGNVYFKFERGYISPSPTQLTDKIKIGPHGASKYVLNDLKSEKFNTYELGMKDLIFDQYFSATTFLTDTKDEITIKSAQGHGVAWNFYNIDKTRRYGLELYSEQYLFDSLKLSQTYSYVNAEIKKGKNKGKKVSNISNSKFVLGIDYELMNNLNLLSDIKYFGSYENSDYEKVDGYTLVDLAALYKIKKNFTILAGIKNLFNKEYNEYESKKYDSYIPATERNFYLEFKYAY